MTSVLSQPPSSDAAALSVRVNGVWRAVAAQHNTVADLVADMQLRGRRIAVEHNGAIVPRSRYGEVRLADGDVLEIVGAVGGG